VVATNHGPFTMQSRRIYAVARDHERLYRRLLEDSDPKPNDQLKSATRA
jgi:hypothetical protein